MDENALRQKTFKARRIAEAGGRMEETGRIQISIIIPAYNTQEYLGETLRSVLAQSFTDFEVLVVDDASTDDTYRVAKDYAARDKRIRCFRNPANRGVSFSRNFGIAQAQYEWVAFLDSDDLWTADKLQKQAALLEKRPDISLCYTGIRYSVRWKPAGVAIHVPETLALPQLLKSNVIPCSSVLVRRELVQAFPFQHDDAHEDYLLWMRLLQDGAAACGIDEPMLIYRMRKGSRSINKCRSARMTWRTYRYLGLPAVQSARWMLFYTAGGLRKYSHIFFTALRENVRGRWSKKQGGGR